MPNVIYSVLTDVGRDQIAKACAGDLTSALTYFLIGEGGYIVSGGVKTPKTPDPEREKLESQGTELTGLVSFTNGSAAVVGNGTLFVTEAEADRWIRPNNPEDGVWYQVLSVTDNTHLTLESVFGGTSSPGGGEASSWNIDAMMTFRKVFDVGDVVFDGPGTRRVTAYTVVDFSEANLNQLGNAPSFFEIGLCDNNGVMIAYGTFPEEVKTNIRRLHNTLGIHVVCS